MMTDINYSGQYLDDKQFKIKIKTGEDIDLVRGTATCGEMFLTTGDHKALYIANETSTVTTDSIYLVGNISKADNASRLPSMNNTLSLMLDGTDQYLDLGTSTDLDISSGGTLSMWVKPDFLNAKDNEEVFSKGGSGDTGGFQLTFEKRTTSPYSPVFRISNHLGETTTELPTYLIENQSNEWILITISFDGLGNVTYFLNDGKLGSRGVTSTHALNILPTNSNGYVGRHPTQMDRNFTGLVDDTAFFNYPLTPKQVSLMYNLGAPGDISSLEPTAWYRMGENITNE